MDISRRTFLSHGVRGLALGLLARRGLAWSNFVPPALPGMGLPDGAPFARVPARGPVEVVDGLPFATWFTGDDFRTTNDIPFHDRHLPPMPSQPPPDAEHVRVAVIGGGISGLASAYLLRQYKPVVLELHPHFGGNAQGEIWHDQPYSLGVAYVITPDPGTFLDQFYRELGLHNVYRLSEPPDPIVISGQIDPDFWSGYGVPPDQRPAFEAYANVVQYMADEGYPCIPLPDDPGDRAWVLELDSRDFRTDLEMQMGMELPPLLAAAVQGYFYSSFGAGMEHISAAGGWNFLAAEEYGRWVFPGGGAYMAHALYKKLAELERDAPDGPRPYFLRAGCAVMDVRLYHDRVWITYLDPQQQVRTILAEYAIIATPKHVAKYLLHDLERIDPPKYEAMQRVLTAPYMVANVLLNQPIERDFYDIFLVEDEQFPMTPIDFQQRPVVTDMLSGHYARRHPKRNVLTLYWPIVWHPYRFWMLYDRPWKRWAQLLAPQVRRMLALLDVPPEAVAQVRMTRWGHALPLHEPGRILDGTADELRRPFEGRVYFVNQDNWLLPAVENSLLDAKTFTDQIAAQLG